MKIGSFPKARWLPTRGRRREKATVPTASGHGKVPNGKLVLPQNWNSWLEPGHPIAKFFGGENKLSIGQRLLAIVAIGIGAAIAVGILANAMVGMSKLGSPP